MEEEPTAKRAGRDSARGSGAITPDGTDLSRVFAAAEASTAPQPAIRTAASAKPAGDTTPHSATAADSEPRPAGDTAPQPAITTAASAKPAGDTTPHSATTAAADPKPAGDTAPQPATAAAADPRPAADTAPQPAIAPEADPASAGDTARQPATAAAADPKPAGDTAAPGRRTGGRRYRARPAPAGRRRDDESPPVPITPFPAGFRARAVLAGLLGWSLASCLLAAWLHRTVAGGVGFCVGSALAAWFCRPAALLRMVTAVPAVFAIAVILAQLVTRPAGRHHGLVLLLAEGTLLALAAVAPWLFAGTTAAVVIAMFRGLPRCVRDLRAELRGRAPAGRARPAPRVQQVQRAPDRGRT